MVILGMVDALEIAQTITLFFSMLDDLFITRNREFSAEVLNGGPPVKY